MSYSQRYTARVQISGSKSVSYPASQNGGTMSVSYSDFEDVNINLFVDTDSFDANVAGCNASVDILSGAVVAVNAAQCAEIEASADKVSTSIVDGFYGMIRSELSQQMTDFRNRFSAQQMQLMQLGKSIVACRDTMQGDYARISDRYRAIFQDLDKECYRRIFVLDQASFDLSKGALADIVSAPRLDEAGRTVSYALEIPGSHGAIVASRLRARIASMISAIADYAEQEHKLTARCESLSLSRPADERTMVYLPCIVVDRDALETGGNEKVAILADADSSSLSAKAEDIRRTAVDSCLQSDLGWAEMSESEKSELSMELARLIEAEAASLEEGESREIGERKLRTLQSLWDKAVPQSPVTNSNKRRA